jgi:alkylhydroperoxidase/carboxymuconolactone decarboxylase family protein YurZ
MPAGEPADSGNGLWDEAALARLREWDPQWANASEKMSTNPWHTGVLSRKFVELVSLALAVACTSLDADATRRHMRAALAEGATREEILLVLKCATVLSIHSCSVAAPILLEEAAAQGIASPMANEPTPACDAMHAAGLWNDAWDPFFDLDPRWTDEFMATGAGIYQSGVLSPKEIEMLSIALDASITHLYAPGIRRHIDGALRAGATRAEVMEVLKLCVAQGVQSVNLGVAILAQELNDLD